MIIGIPREIKTKETRVAMRVEDVKGLIENGHTIIVEKDAGLLSGMRDKFYESAGAKIVSNADEVWKQAEMIVKVKEPLESEYKYFRPDLTIFTYLHLASVPSLVDALCESKTTAIGYETVADDQGHLPLLVPMSEVAGRIATQIGTYLLHKDHGGKGLLLGGVTGTARGTVVVIGGGIVGRNAADVAHGLRADTVILDINERVLESIDREYRGGIKAVKSDAKAIAEWAPRADLLVGAVLVAGDRAPHLVSEAMVDSMKYGSVIVDVAVDQGGCVETTRPTSHDDPTYLYHEVTHYAVPNMPALTPYTSTEALTRATFPYIVKLASKGVEKTLAEDRMLAKGLQTRGGKVTLPVLRKLFPKWA